MVSVLNYAGVCLPLLKNSALCLWSKSDMLSWQPWILLAVFRLNTSWMYTPLIDMSLCYRWCRSRDIFIARKCRTWARKSSKLCAYTYIQGGPKIQHRILCKLVLNHIKERKWIYPYTTRSFARELLPMTFNSLVLIFLTVGVCFLASQPFCVILRCRKSWTVSFIVLFANKLHFFKEQKSEVKSVSCYRFHWCFLLCFWNKITWK